ncbi:carbon-nitrogen family hydrolase [Staphylococcus saprophyticus]|uniref:carbon-nitrogen family hydrolase n=1 Tax=Staphylococcus saprophyticus TaxID=29385 RepID=UPI000E03DDFF|nr:carbon-nitrogen family hydrolase [Staphylococcus saprophyticus]MDW4261004.1 carbon-nitrogen family hydrolase [Staphylococcus saprophyticus]SUM62606.1 amidohydrolase [Staphylococcus saprophyticus]SUM74459.1 amidohydrolase [Staphylococcus saprophyticus]VDZ22203.1 amidohydrolase [Staphylococcus saprophyticus]
MNIEIFQFKVEPANTELNEETIATWFSNYVTSQTDVVVLPEMWNNGYALPQLQALSDSRLSRSYEFISKLAIKYQVDVIAGSVSNAKSNEVYNTAFAVSKYGKLLNNYDKVHLVPMLNEPSFLNAGNAVPESFNLSNGARVTQIICYDLRFPELLRYPARKDAQIAFYVAQWPLVRLDHWIALLKARAIENDMYVIGCNGCGDDGQTEYAGNSIVINPNGEILSQLGYKPDHITCEIDLEEVDKQRDTIPVFKNLRPHLYK